MAIVTRGVTSLFVVQDAPYPPRSGSPLRAWQNINLLAELGAVHVFSVGKREPDASMPVAASWTHIDANDFPVRAAGTIARIRRGVWPREFPIENDFVGNEINGRLSAIVERLRPDVIVVSHWHTALPRALRRRHILIADAHNIESEVAMARIASRTGKPSLRERYQIAQWRRRERAYLRAVDRIWATSERDARALAAEASCTVSSIDIVPNAVDVRAYDGIKRNGRIARSPAIGYIGFFGYEPNAEAATELIGAVFPRIRSRYPGARLLLVGKSPTEDMRRAAIEDANIVVTGLVENVREWLAQFDVLAVPLRSGSGTRLKILEAFAARIPVVSTPKGIEGIEALAGVHAEVCSIPDMADACLSLLGDEARLTRQTAAAYDLVVDRYSWTALARSDVVSRLKEDCHRALALSTNPTAS